MPRNFVALQRERRSWQPMAWSHGARSVCWIEPLSTGRAKRQKLRPTTTQREIFMTFGDKRVSFVCSFMYIQWWSHPCAPSISFLGMWRLTWSSADCCVNSRLGPEDASYTYQIISTVYSEIKKQKTFCLRFSRSGAASDAVTDSSICFMLLLKSTARDPPDIFWWFTGFCNFIEVVNGFKGKGARALHWFLMDSAVI